MLAMLVSGAKRSGFGRFNSLPGLEEWVRTKVITWQDEIALVLNEVSGQKPAVGIDDTL